MKKFMLNVGTAVLQNAGGYDFSGLEQVELEAELLGNIALYRRQDGQLMMHVSDPISEDGKMVFFLLEITLEEAKQKITWLEGAKFSRN